MQLVNACLKSASVCSAVDAPTPTPTVAAPMAAPVPGRPNIAPIIAPPAAPIIAPTAAPLAACDSGPLLRDQYAGQDAIAPELRPERVRRDNLGNPILREKTPEEGGFWRRLMGW